MNFLFVAFEYPPMTTGGSQRPARFARALVNEGHEVAVVTSGEATHSTNDSGVWVYHIPAKAPNALTKFTESSWLNLTDGAGRRWRKALLSALPEIVAKHKPDVLWVTVPPFGIAQLGVEVARRLGLPLLLDMRDAWSQWGIAPYPTRFHYRAVCALEKRVLEAADAVCVTTHEMRDDLLRAQPLIHPSKITVIQNGYEGVSALPTRNTLREPTEIQPIRIGYVGSFYYTPKRHWLMTAKWYHKHPHQWFQYRPRLEDWKYRSPYFVFEAFRAFKTDHPEEARLIKLEFVGIAPSWLRRMAQDAGIEDNVVFHGVKPHTEVIDFIKACDAVLATSVKVENGLDYCIAGKTYEYIQLGKPVLGFVTPGAQRDFLASSGLLMHVDPDTLSDGKALFQLLAKGGANVVPNPDFIVGASIKVRVLALISKALEIVPKQFR